ncbi:MAG TPA: Asp-tRNA(Asn)/Glu-tRNA(Gln) amidotransferase subunit GatB [Flavisolibacter sp.]|jgi:aspartyl-tRNA(Asn)/glutamyl-tRNA(Gln) amidotransferase subunit B|nr:Asp-tRNA(Asn)/Glu-tRNA(Gln) amidotransferase subunit GatB [Flavisolibacter sp.]
MGGKEIYEIVVGLEVHAQLSTQSKLFCGDSTVFGAEPNTQVSVISLGHPGSLPMLNKRAITMAVQLGLATNCEIVRNNYFARKNYFYPDLPKGYQISQHTTPICRNGFLEIDGANENRKIRINRIHMEEDAGKSLHNESDEFTNLDFNRAGMPLLEIVTEPDIRSAEEAFSYVTKLRKLVRHLGVCDGNMEQGSLRCDVNISIRKKGETKLGTKVEIKNLNSIRFIKKAIQSETDRLIALVEKGEVILQQTRGFNEDDFSTYAIRTKEDEDDYRYFAEPDLPPFFINDEMLQKIRSEMPMTEEELKQELISKYSLPVYDASQLSEHIDLIPFFKNIAAETSNNKAAVNWVIGPVRTYLLNNDLTIEHYPVKEESITTLINLIDKGVINYGIATQKILPQLINDPSLDIIDFLNKNALNVSNDSSEIDSFIEAALNKHENKITEYKKGKKGLISLFVGEVMKLSKGKADARIVTEKLIEKLKA